MRITLVTPARAGSLKGNRVTALRWAGILRYLGHRVTIAEQYERQATELLVALHARRSFPSIVNFRREWPDKPLVVALTGTDLYGDIHDSPQAQQSLELADRLIVLQPLGLAQLPQHLHDKTRVIFQSSPSLVTRPRKLAGWFEVSVVGHLRPVKDPFRAAKAARLLPETSKIRIIHLGSALSEAMAKRARAEQSANPRYRWLGQLPRNRALARLARSRLLVVSSRLEGGANTVSEALAAGVPVISSRIDGSVGVLGEDYPGYFEVGDTGGLADLLARAEADPRFYASLERHCRRLAAQVDPSRERAAWRLLLAEFEKWKVGS